MSRSNNHIAETVYNHRVATKKLEVLWEASPEKFNAVEAAKHAVRMELSFPRVPATKPTPPTRHSKHGVYAITYHH